MSDEEYVELRVKLPKRIVDFARACLLRGRDEAEYWTKTLMRSVEADADDEDYLFEDVEILRKYGLSKEAFDC